MYFSSRILQTISEIIKINLSTMKEWKILTDVSIEYRMSSNSLGSSLGRVLNFGYTTESTVFLKIYFTKPTPCNQLLSHVYF